MSEPGPCQAEPYRPVKRPFVSGRRGLPESARNELDPAGRQAGVTAAAIWVRARAYPLLGESLGFGSRV